jgi:succinate dehydrogenase/fumarate reductase cytochrome b subunit
MALATHSMGREAALRERRWGRIQAASGLAFAAFAAVHLLNQWLAPLGPEAYDGFQAAARAIYQHPAVELALVALPLLVHVVAGLRRMRLRGVRGRRGGWRMRLHRITGYALLAVIFGHVLAVRGPSLVYGFFPGFAGVSFSLWWMPGWFYLYYTLFGASALYHGINGTLLALHALGLRSSTSIPGGRLGLLAPVGLGSALLVLALLAFGGRLFPIADPRENPYAEMWEQRFGAALERQ